MCKIKYKNLKIWLVDQWKRKTFFRNFFITRNAWGAFSINSHINQHKGEPKICYSTKEKAQKAADKMGEKTGKHFSIYTPLLEHVSIFIHFKIFLTSCFFDTLAVQACFNFYIFEFSSFPVDF